MHPRGGIKPLLLQDETPIQFADAIVGSDPPKQAARNRPATSPPQDQRLASRKEYDDTPVGRERVGGAAIGAGVRPQRYVGSWCEALVSSRDGAIVFVYCLAGDHVRIPTLLDIFQARM